MTTVHSWDHHYGKQCYEISSANPVLKVHCTTALLTPRREATEARVCVLQALHCNQLCQVYVDGPVTSSFTVLQRKSHWNTCFSNSLLSNL